MAWDFMTLLHRDHDELQRGLDYPSKLSRQPVLIDRLIADGEAQAKSFLDALVEEEERPPVPAVEGPPIDLH